MICLLSNFVPHVELEHIWSFDKDEIIGRFKLKEQFDPIVRLFGEKQSKRKKKWLSKFLPRKVNDAGVNKMINIGERLGLTR